MKIYNQSKTEELKNYSLEEGYLQDSSLVVGYTNPQEEKQEISHIKIIKEYPNGGKDIEIVIDTPYQPAKEKEPICEEIKVYIPYSTKEVAKIKIEKLKNFLKSTDYVLLKIAEAIAKGDSVAVDSIKKEYQIKLEERKKAREEIAKLEDII